MTELWDTFWNGFTLVPRMIYDKFQSIIDFVVDLPELFLTIVSYIPEPLRTVLIAFLPIIIILITYRVIEG